MIHTGAVIAGWLMLIGATANPVRGGSLPEYPSLAVLSIEAGEGMAPEVVRVLTDLMVSELRASGRFSRVVSYQELQTMLDYEKQKQLADCDNKSCLAELLGALGVDLVVTGTFATLGPSRFFSVKMMDMRSAQTLAAVMRKLPSDKPEALSDAVIPMVRELLRDAATNVASPQVTSEEGGWRRWSLSSVGAALVVGALLGVPFAVALMGAGLVTQLVPRMMALPLGPVPYYARVMLVHAVTGMWLVCAGIVTSFSVAELAAGMAALIGAWS